MPCTADDDRDLPGRLVRFPGWGKGFRKLDMARRVPATSRLPRLVARIVALATLLTCALAATAHAGVNAGTTSVYATEGGSPGSYSISLDAEPSAPVTVRFHTGPQLAPIADLVIDPPQWDQPHAVTVVAVDDQVAEMTHFASIEHSMSSSDADFAQPTPTMARTVSIIDNDMANVLVTAPAGLPLAEGSTGTWQLSLTSEPVDAVHLSFTGDGQVGVGGGTLTFDATNWNQPQPVSVLALGDDVAEGSHSGTFSIEVTASDPVADDQYDWLVVPDQTVPIADDDTPGILLDPVAPGRVSLQEGGTPATYTIRLASQPTGDVSIDLAPLTGQVTVTPDLIVFTPSSWSVRQAITVSAVSDVVPESSPHTDWITHTSNSTDPQYASLTLPDMRVDIDDDDTPSFIVTDPDDMTLAERDGPGTERQLGIRLSMPPAGTVRVNAISDGQVQFGGTSVLTFDSTNWNVTQYFRVQAADDTIAEPSTHPGRVSFGVHAPNDPQYSSLGIAMRTFQVADDDIGSASMSCDPGPGWNTGPDGSVRIAERSDDPAHRVGCYLRLGTAPAGDVTFTTVVTPADQVTVDRPTVTIPAGETTSQLITFTAVDDPVAEGRPHPALASIAVTSTDAVYGTMGLAPIRFEIADDDEAGIKVLPDGPVTVAEGREVEVKLALRSRPTAPVSIGLGVHPQLELLAPTSPTLLFDAANWNVPQVLRLKAVDDAVAEGNPHAAPVALTLSTSDARYVAMAVAPIGIAISDDDVPGVKVESNATGPLGEGAARDYAIRLRSLPAGPVTLTIAGDAQVGVAPGELQFTPDTWNVPQTVTVTATQDTVFEGSHPGVLTISSISPGDPVYAAGGAGAPQPVTVTIADDEEGGVTIVESDGGTAVTEAGGADTYTVVLKAQPSADVIIKVDGGGQVAATPASLTFTAESWNVAQTVTLVGVQDDLDEADTYEVQVTHAVETSAAGWAGIALPAVAGKVTDDDAAKITASQTEDTTRVLEGAKQGDTVVFRLSTQPTADVTITPKGDPQLAIDEKPIVFTPAAWKEPRELSVRAKDDKEREGDHAGSLTLAVASADPAYGKLTLTAITVAIADDDSDVTVAPDGDTGGGTEDEEVVTRKPRGGGGRDGERTRSSAGGAAVSNGSSAGDERRSEAGAERTSAGEERTDAGFGLGGSGTGKKEEEEEAAPAEQLDGEVMSATEKPKAKPKPKGPGMVAKAASWAKRNWESVAPVVGVGLMGASAATFFLKGDPMRAAERALTSRGGAGGSGGSSGKAGDRPDARRPKKKKKKRAGSGSEDEDSPGTDTKA